jgi:hypothetical protein
MSVITVVPRYFRSPLGRFVGSGTECMHGHVSHTDKRCPCGASYGRFRHGNPHTPIQTYNLFIFRHRKRRVAATFARTGHSYLIMSSHSQTAIGSSTDGIPLPPDPTPIFELNQAKRAKLAAELESLRSGKCRIFDLVLIDAHARYRLTHFQQHTLSGRLWKVWRRLSRRRSNTTK